MSIKHNIMKWIIRNYKTTIPGIVSIIWGIIQKDGAIIAAGCGLLAAKDGDKTGDQK